MVRSILFAVLAALPMIARAQTQPEPAPPAFTVLTDEFARFADKTVDLPDAERVEKFHAVFDPLLPGFYNNKGKAQARFDTMIAASLKSFPKDRAGITATTERFADAYATGEARFRKFFPDYRQQMPVYLVHSINQMDGGTRTVKGRTTLLFGADMIARIHDQSTIGLLLDHELFHSYHARFFRDCAQIWCSLWSEGLAVYVTQRMNPGATDRQLLLTLPVAIRPVVEPRLGEAMCLLRIKMESTSQTDYAEFFNFRMAKSEFPSRFGYFLGLLIAEKIGSDVPIATLVKLPNAKVRPLIDKAIASYGPCPALLPAQAAATP
ncbi:MAG: hypothetical protein BVN32_08940 [Proteobacteria bacterium ST_bin14]|nr:MAG: hypothetical protein BVN32_08940 [Proteobacteria bacterium ST_bin14]